MFKYVNMILKNYGTKLLLILRWLLTSKFPKRLWVVEAGALLLSMDVRSFELELFENPLNRTEWSCTCQKCMKIDDSLFLIITVNGYHLDMRHMTNECKWQVRVPTRGVWDKPFPCGVCMGVYGVHDQELSQQTHLENFAAHCPLKINL